MSNIFDDLLNRSKTGCARKEDLVPISVKITKRVPYYDWTEYYVQFKNDDTRHWVRWCFYFPKPNMKVENILPILAEHGLDTKNISKEDWPDLVKGTGRFQEADKWRDEQHKTAREEGQVEKTRYIDYSYTSEKLREGEYLVRVTMRMYGGWRKFKYVFEYIPDNWEYEDDQTGKTRYTPIMEAIAYDVEGMIECLPHLNLTKEEWLDNNFFKEMYDQARATIRRYNNRYRY